MTAALVVAAIAPFLRALAFGYVYDDTFIVQHNPAIVGWRSLLTLWRHPYWMDGEGAQAGLYRPVHTAILAIIRNGGGGWPLWFHLYAILLHGVVTFLVWRMLARAVGRWPAALAALWFAVHPVHVEAVANISNSAEPLAALWMLGLYFVLTRSAGRAISWRDALRVGTLYLLAMLSKESGAVSLAIALFAAGAWRSAGDVPDTVASDRGEQTLISLWHRWGRVAVTAVVALAVVGVARAMVLGRSLDGASMAAVGIEKLTVAERAWKMFSLGPTIVRLLAWPRVQNPYYGPSSFPTGWRGVLATTMTLIVVGGAVVAAIRLARGRGEPTTRDTRPLAAIGWTLLAFLPASNLVFATGQILAERTLYPASIGVAMLLAWGMDRMASAIQHSRSVWMRRPEIARMAMAIGCGASLIVCARLALLAQRATEAWRSHRALIEEMIAADPLGYRGHYLLALELRNHNVPDSIASEFATAYRLYQQDPQMNLDYARFLIERQQPARAVEVSRTLMEDSRTRNDPEAIAVYLEARGRAYGADSVLVEAYRLHRQRPDRTTALYIGLAQEARADRAAALRAYREGLRLAPDDSALAAGVARVQ